jgi:hypothetical protein
MDKGKGNKHGHESANRHQLPRKGRLASHKSNPSSALQGYVGWQHVWKGCPEHMLAIRTLGHVGGGNRCGEDTL